MSVGLLLISHDGIASHLLNTAKKMLGTTPLATRVLDVPFDAPVDQIQTQAQSFIEILDKKFDEAGIYDGTGDKFPNFFDAAEELQRVQFKGRRMLWQDSCSRILKTFTFGPAAGASRPGREAGGPSAPDVLPRPGVGGRRLLEAAGGGPRSRSGRLSSQAI